MNREQLIEKIEMTKAAIPFAGPIHRRDLRKHMKRMMAQLKQYDRYQKEAKQVVA